MHNEGGRNRKNTEKKTGKTEVKNAGKKKKKRRERVKNHETEKKIEKLL